MAKMIYFFRKYGYDAEMIVEAVPNPTQSSPVETVMMRPMGRATIRLSTSILCRISRMMRWCAHDERLFRQ
jgi:hypothetical protein